LSKDSHYSTRYRHICLISSSLEQFLQLVMDMLFKYKWVGTQTGIILCCSLMLTTALAAQSPKGTSLNDPEAGAILDRASAKFKSYVGTETDFSLTTIRPKLKAEEPDSKYASIDNGKLIMRGNRFKIDIHGHEVICDGKNIWTYAVKDKEAQVNYYEESKEVFSPTKIFTLLKEGFAYQIKEKKSWQGKAVTVIELAPVDRRVSYFKIDVAIEDQTHAIIESKIYEKSGVRYIYKIVKLKPNAALADDIFVFDPKKYVGVNIVDLR
jgi:outer membrane lipoprotein carrier protein